MSAGHAAKAWAGADMAWGAKSVSLGLENKSTNLRSCDFGPALMSIQCQQPVSPAHHSPVIFVGSSAERTYLVVAAIGIGARPAELVRATSTKNPLQEIHYFTPSLRLLHVSSQWLKNNLGRISSRCCSVDKSSFGGWDLERKVSTASNLAWGNGP